MMAGGGGDYYSGQHISKLEQELKEVKSEKAIKEKKISQLQA